MSISQVGGVSLEASLALENVVLKPYVKAGDTKANTYLFRLGERGKLNYLSFEELEWLTLNIDTVEQIMTATRDQVRTASERKTEREAQKLAKEGKKRQSSTIEQAQFFAMMQQMMQNMMQMQKQG